MGYAGNHHPYGDYLDWNRFIFFLLINRKV
jgi:hypothetical protein